MRRVGLVTAILIALGSSIALPATSASGTPTVTPSVAGHYEITLPPIASGVVVLNANGTMTYGGAPAHYQYIAGFQLTMKVNLGGCHIVLEGFGNPKAGFGGTWGESPGGGPCGPPPFSGYWTMYKT